MCTNKKKLIEEGNIMSHASSWQCVDSLLGPSQINNTKDWNVNPADMMVFSSASAFRWPSANKVHAVRHRSTWQRLSWSEEIKHDSSVLTCGWAAKRERKTYHFMRDTGQKVNWDFQAWCSGSLTFCPTSFTSWSKQPEMSASQHFSSVWWWR